MRTFEELYSVVRDLPIVDWHNHLDMRMLAEDRPLGSLYEVWVKADPYKHRAMRICGEPEELITGGSADLEVRAPMGGMGGSADLEVRAPGEGERWKAWMRTLPKLVGNPIFAWAKMELEFLGLDAAKYLRGEGDNISLADWTPSRLLKAMKVETVCPCVGAKEFLKVTGSCVPVGARTSRSAEGSSACGNQVDVGARTSRSATPLLHEFTNCMSDVSSHFVSNQHGGTFHRHNLPHIAHDSALIFVTFRLADSLPRTKLVELTGQKEGEDDRRRLIMIEQWLDAGYGSCELARPACRQIVEQSLEYFNDNGDGNGRYKLHSYVVMPNHVHVLFELKAAEDLQFVLKSWKSFTGRRINELLGKTGAFWQEEYFDRIVRDYDHYGRVIRYIRENAKVGERLANGGSADLEVRAPKEGTGDGSSADLEVRAPKEGTGDGSSADLEVRAPGNVETGKMPFPMLPSLRMNAGDVVTDEQLAAFAAAGCRVVDVSVDDDDDLERHFDSLAKVAGFAAAQGWTMLLHLGALRETSARLRRVAGPAGGYAGMRVPVDPAKVARFLGWLESSADLEVRAPGEGSGCSADLEVRAPGAEGSLLERGRPRPRNRLPRTILLSLNPEAHAQFAVLAGSFNEEGIPGKVQLGPAWWWCDHEEGIRDVLEKNAAYGVLSTFIGMTTDSRSLLSFVRHDYFRRILCKWVAEKIESGVFPEDDALIRPLLEKVCYLNAKEMI